MIKSTDFISRPGIRLWNPQTRKYLHASGSGEVQSEVYAWRGFYRQADVLMQRAQIRGDEWPYEPIEVTK
jgi:hypothetical protein